ncbi:MAG: fibronectin type III domain-containing protein [Paludibacteraceae bacterium]|nr:fibronectin type III domain-containing protein [Paludibacteraceae bacterium]
MTTSSVQLSWTPAEYSVNPSVYTVQYSSDGGTNWTTASTTATSPYTVTGLNSAVDYTFKVSGVSGLEEAEATVDAATTMPLPLTYTHFSEDVLSIYSTQYGEEIAGAYQGDAWSDAANGTYAIDGSHTVKKYAMAGGANSNKGILWLVDGLGAAFGDYDKLHVDIFIPDDAVTRTLTKIAVWGGELNGTPVYETSLTLNAWNSFDVPISRFGRSNTNRLCIVPMIGDGYPDTPYTLYMDNYFIYNGDETCEFSKEMLNVQNTTRIEGAGVMIYFEGYGTEYARNAAHYTVEGRASDGAVTPNIQAATAEYLYVTLGRAPGANELTEITLTHQDGAAVKMKFQGGTLISTRDVCGQCPDSPEPQHDEGDVKHLYVSRYGTVNQLTNLNYYSQSTGSTIPTTGGLNVLKFAARGTGSNTVMVNCTNGALTDVSGNDYLHVDIFFPDNGTIDSRYLRVGLQEQYYTIPSQEIVLGQWNSFDIPLNAFNVADYANMANGACNCFRASLDPVQNLGNTQPTVPYNIYVDNWYFYAVEGCDASAPAEAAADPDDDADAVISLFSDSYEPGVATFTTNNGVLFGFAGTAQLEEVTAGNYAYKYNGLSHLGFQVPAVDVSDKHGFCFDIWAEKPVAFSIRGGNNNLNRDFGSYEVSCGWNHIEVMFTPEQKSAMNNRLSQLAIDLPKNNQTMPIPCITYIDNLYLFTEPLSFTFTKRLAAQRVCRVQTDGLMRRVQVYNETLSQKLRDIALATPAGSCSIDISDLPAGNYVVYVYDTLGRVAEVKAVHVVY